jgi:rubrerythrin
VQTEENATANVQSQESATTETSPAIKTEQLKTTPEPATQTTPSADKNSKKTGVFLVPNQKGVPEGQIRWFCRDCGKSFIASAVEIPGICPAKHQAK